MRLFRSLFNSLKVTVEEGNKSIEQIVHHPVLAKEITQTLDPQDGQCFIDMTFGGGGHTKHLLATHKKITIFALDRDPEAFQRAIVLSRNVTKQNNGQMVIPLLGRFSELPNLLNNFKMPNHFVDGAIMDLGASSFQFEEGIRGFSVKADGPLDMRMDGNRFPNMPTAADVINSLDADDLTKIFKTYGEERHAVKIAQTIIDSRFLMKNLNSTRELATLVSSVLCHGNRHDKLGREAHPATKVFQALRIFVNNELNELEYGIELLSRYLKRSKQSNDTIGEDDGVIEHERNGAGLLAVISFHSLEDKLVKGHFMGDAKSEHNLADHSLIEQPNVLNVGKPWKFYKERLIYPSKNEVFHNPRSRSAKLRFAIRTNS